MKLSEIGTLKNIPMNGRRGILRSQTVDTFLHILSVCYSNSSHINQISDKGETETCIESVTKNDIIPKDSICEEGGLDDKLDESAETQLMLDTEDGKLVKSAETQVVLDTQEGDVGNKLVESSETRVILDGTDITLKDSLSQLQMFMDLDTVLAESVECDDNILGELNDLLQKVDTNPSTSSDIKNHDNFDKDVEEGEIASEFMDSVTEDETQSVDKTGIELGLEIGNNSIPLLTDIVENVGKNVTGGVRKTTRNLVDYSEVVVPRKPREYAKPVSSEHVLPPLTNSKNSATKNQDLVYPLKEIGGQNNKKRVGSCTEDEKAIKKAKKSADENFISLGELPKDISQKVVDASVNEDASNEKKKKRVMSKERKAKKKRKERIKRAENNRKLGVKRLKLEPMIKEKTISYCRHYMVGRCHEGEKCKFSHDTIPLTKSKACFHFARHACMKGDDCPFDHELSKYPCNNLLTRGFCNRGSDCMFSHEAKLSEARLDASEESKLEQKVDAKSCFVPKKQNIVKITPKLSATPPKGISFLSQEIPKTPPVNQNSKDTTKKPTLIQYTKKKFKTSPAVQDSEEITKTPPVIQEVTKTASVTPRGINFLSFGKKTGLDQSNVGFSFKISNGIERSRLSNLDDKGLKSELMLNEINEVKVKVDFLADKPSSSQKPIAMMPFMSSISQKSLQSTLDFASKLLDSGVNINRQI